MEDAYSRLRRLRLETEVGELRLELEGLAGERTRLARRNEALVAILSMLRSDPRLDETTRSQLDDAMAFDGHEPVGVAHLGFDFDLFTTDREDPNRDRD